MIHEQVQKVRLQIYAVQEVVPTPTPPVQLSYPGEPQRAREEIIRLFKENQPRPNANRWRLSGGAKFIYLWSTDMVEDLTMAVLLRGLLNKEMFC